jgi:hypothetical protein
MWFLMQKDFGHMMLKEIKMMEGNIFPLLNVYSIDLSLFTFTYVSNFLNIYHRLSIKQGLVKSSSQVKEH